MVRIGGSAGRFRSPNEVGRVEVRRPTSQSVPLAPRSFPALPSVASPGATRLSALASRTVTRHRLDPDRDAIGQREVAARIGPAAASLYLGAARKAAGEHRVDRLESGRMSLGELFRLAAKGLFGADACKPITYAAFESRFLRAGAESEFRRLMGGLPREQLTRCLEGAATPIEVLTIAAGAVASFRLSTAPISLTQLKVELTREGALDDLARAKRQMSATQVAALEAGEVSPAQFDLAVDEDRALNTDVVIIGAGMAGLAAAQALKDRGIDAVVLEAKDRIGGRMWTESESVGAPFDRGAAWLHNAPNNPLMPITEKLGFTTVADTAPSKAFDGVGDPDALAAHFDTRVERIDRALSQAPFDVAASRVVDLDDPWDAIAADTFAHLSHGVDLTDMSTRDYQTIFPEHGDRYVREGFGRVVGAFGHGARVRLDTPVQTVQWSDDGVKVSAGGKTYCADKVLFTASVGVLAKGHIAFDPPLPPWKADAIDQIAMGRFEKIALRFNKNVFAGTAPGAHVRNRSADGKAMEFVVRPFGDNVAVGFVGGSFADELLGKGEDAAVAYALGRLRAMYGAAVDDAFAGATVTNWSSDPHTEGSFSAARPGGQRARKALRAPVGDTVHFAGEATHEQWAQCVPGAYLTGRDAADDIARSLERAGLANRKLG